MKALFNCSVIKNVYLRPNISTIELEITYTDNPNQTWWIKKSLENLSDKDYHKERYEKAYDTIKQALLNGDKFVEIEL